MRGYRRWRAWPAENRPGLGMRALRLVLQVVILGYALAIVGFIWMMKDLTISMLAQDPLFAGMRTICTEHGAWRTTLSDTLPRRNRSIPFRPCDPITIRSGFHSAAASRIA